MSFKKKVIVVVTLVNNLRIRKIFVNYGLFKILEESKELFIFRALVLDIFEGLNEVKRFGLNEKRVVFRVFTFFLFGENIKKIRVRKFLGKLVNLNEMSISKAIRN